MLSVEERAELHAVLQSAFPSMALLDVLVGQLDRLPDNIPGATITARVQSLINLAEGQGFLEKLLTTAATQTDQSDNTTLHIITDKLLTRIRERAAARWLESEDPYQVAFLYAGRALINRRKLRTSIKDLCSNQGSRVLIVNGNPMSGKSYSMQYIAHLAEAFQDDRAYIDIKREIQTSFGPDALARSIGWQMKLSAEDIQSIPVRQSQDARWVMEIRDWIIGASNRAGKRWWITLDGFDHPDLPPETQQMIEHLMLQIENVKPPLRLVLLSYQRPIPRDIRRYIQSEAIGPIERDELTEFFERLYELAHKAVTQAELVQIVDKVLALVPTGDPERLYYVAEAVEQIAQLLFPREA